MDIFKQNNIEDRKFNTLSRKTSVSVWSKKKRINISDYPLKVGGYLLSHLV